MGFLVFDTETTGLFNFGLPAEGHGQPRLASVAFIWTDNLGRETQRQKLYVRPDGWSMTPAAAAVNRLTDEFLTEHGVPVGTVLDIYETAVRSGRPVAAFNAQLDCKVMRAEFRRAGRDDLFTVTHNTCLQRAARNLADIGFTPAKRGFPNLRETSAFFGHTVVNAHDAMDDAEAARAILENLIRIGRLIPPDIHFAKEKPAA